MTRSREMIEAELDGEILALSVESGDCFGFNATASAVWARLANPISFRELVDSLLDEFDASREECERQTRALLDDLHSRKLIGLATDRP